MDEHLGELIGRGGQYKVYGAGRGRVLKVPGDFTNPTNTTESRANGFCHSDPTPDTIGAVIDIDFPDS